MSRIKNENFIVIQGFMINELNLKGNELIVYATIYGFSQTENQVFSGSLQYLADWTNSTKQGVIKNLKSLVEKGYIVKNDKVINGVKFCEYYVTKFNTRDNRVEQGSKQSLTPGIKQSIPEGIKHSLPNNIPPKVINKKDNEYIEIIDELVSDNDIKELVIEFIKMRKLIKKPMTERALKQLINKLYNLTENKRERLEILENSIINNWANVYPLKAEKRREVVPDWINNKEPKKEQPADLSERVAALKKKLANG